MNYLWCLFLFLFMPTSLFAAAPNTLLRVGITHFSPPFVMESSKQWYGFDITMMEQVCATLKRHCIYISMPFEKLLNAVKEGQVDVGVSSIIITPERAKWVNFSTPYLTSNTRFLSRSHIHLQTVNIETLKKTKIGAEEGTIFIQQLLNMGVPRSNILTFKQEPEVIDALIKGNIDFALVVEPSAIYWQTISSGELTVRGDPMPYGFGFGVAVKPGDDALLHDINEALLQFQNGEEFQKDFHIYLESL